MVVESKRCWTTPHVHAGRPPTRLGGDGWPPSVRVARWQTRIIADELRHRGVAHAVRPDCGFEIDGQCFPSDRIEFPLGDVRALQEFFAEWLPPLGRYRGREQHDA